MRNAHSFNLIAIIILIGCASDKNEDATLFGGLWYFERDDKVWFVNDSLILFCPFYPYSKWEMHNDTLRILNLASLQLDSPIWFEYYIDSINGREAHVKFLEEDEGFLKFQRITQLENSDLVPEKLSLIISDCEYDEDCVNLKIEINISESKVNILEVKESGRNFTCTLDSQELFSIKYFVSRVPWGEINKPLFSNEMHSIYFGLNVEFKDASQNKKVLSDTGGFAPGSIDNLITFIWATSQLRCMPEEYRKDLFSH